MKLEEFKKKYADLGKKYGLPSFTELNNVFEIDKIERDSDTLLREIRKVLMDKVINYIRLFEMIFNPASAPPTFLAFVREIRAEERSSLEKVYKECVELELLALARELEHNEKAEAELIANIYKVMTGLKGDLTKVISMMSRNWRLQVSKKEKSYFG